VELLQKRGTKYSSRIPDYVHELVTRERNFVTSPYNDFYKKVAPIMHKTLGTKTVADHIQYIEACSAAACVEIFKKSEAEQSGFYPKHQFKFAAINVILSFAYSAPPRSINDPLLRKIDETVDELFRLIAPENDLSSFFPILKLLPNNSRYKRLLEIREELENVVATLDAEEGNNGRPSFARDLKEQRDQGVLDDLDVTHLLITLLNAGTDTLTCAFTFLAALLVNHPDVQAKAHEELDSVVGPSRLPSHTDSLPYIRAIIKESLRIQPPSFLGVPHYLESDDEFEGYYIPAQSVVVVNEHALHYDPNVFPDPEKFDPSRFLSFPEKNSHYAHGDVYKRDHFAFGAGRRLCVGIHLAEAELESMVSMILWAFKLEGGDGPNGTIDIQRKNEGFINFPADYRMRFVPRRDDVLSYLQNSSVFSLN